MRMRATLVPRLAEQPPRQRRRNDAKETDSLHDATRTPRIQFTELAVGPHEMRPKSRRRCVKYSGRRGRSCRALIRSCAASNGHHCRRTWPSNVTNYALVHSGCATNFPKIHQLPGCGCGEICGRS